MQQFQFRIRQATPDDIDAIMAVFAQARAAIAVLGIDQWQDGYPAVFSCKSRRFLIRSNQSKEGSI